MPRSRSAPSANTTVTTSHDHRRKRINIYFIDRECPNVVAVELKYSSDLPRVIAEANAKYGLFLACGAPIDAIRPAGDEPLPDVQISKRESPTVRYGT